ncbi:Origin recognition complex subunit 3 [Conoideocrella luteorostrata]|uniref:Origin recognition complex subunit 3 n=1 Tax=Conoideocrella luteorostrata TaxID=1105319 RepID=A0AAJ0CQI0_9HYPO|nr:Origin recognition complex subunit 3 [Conoideocrella luteorostrata]
MGYSSWRPQIPFTLLFGIATSVELLQTRLLKSACRLIYGGQFDGVQTASILEAVFRGAVAAADVPLRLGAPLLRSMLDRQHEQVAGIQSFISSLKYAYMCHFYANPLSVLCFSDEDTEVLQREHLEAVRNLWSFRHTVEAEVEKSTLASLEHAKSLIEDNEYLLSHVRTGYRDRQAWTDRFLRSLLIMQAAGMQRACFSKVYVDSMVEGAQLSSAQSGLTQSIRRMGPDELSGLLHRVIAILNTGDSLLNLGPCVDERDIRLHTSLESKLEELKQLQAHAQEGGMALRSKYSGHSKVMRTTVIAQKVQLSQDSAALSDQDNRLTEMIDEVTSLLSSHYPDTNPNTVLLAECWLYETKSPSREVFVPRPWVAFERSLGRPHDYLNCSCCRPDSQGLQATLPPTSILYQMYLETGSLINVADLWAAFYALVQGEEDERKALMLFYRGLAEMRALGFVKSSKKKADHIAKVKWL